MKCTLLHIFIHTIYIDCTSVISELSKRWRELPPDEQESWKSKALEGCCWSEKPRKKVVRDLTSSIEGNVSHSLVVQSYFVFAFADEKPF